MLNMKEASNRYFRRSEELVAIYYVR